ncbi:1-(5-phosphoribosyl)-5-[(5-phosphoribosylamino)methylideneamino] imidazole-4-carboxamide isomerase [Bremerella volcania]|uniref:1-(5-phosphoribosyl)-5-[(5-phosphoribosylamino)methylideneamino] imidazole-4-carboxamide isomerase n=1 Tax=Bremerella volcania TaxID=2527984 RepID=A0A518C3G3_9BACT|nr:HisA/HisF-related TIM barrel protein [Bremerella volcania]QDU73768.1 1-(5-phosphoribosyl)-5-[(5-phosphoribosylamino)methylideneamino] imidazole-4-carboxamide isomerase [Bremerella volcania]
MTSHSDRPAWYDAILPVIDLRHGQVVRGIAGRRDEYQPVESRYADDSRPGSIAHVYASQFGFQDCYVADLGAILDGQIDVAALEAIAVQGLKVWLDAGIGNVRQWQASEEALRDWRPYRWVVGLESLESWQTLEELLACISPERLVFSLDMKDGRPMSTREAFIDQSPEQISRHAAELGVKSMILLDLAAVGQGEGSQTESLMQTLQEELPDVELIGGGGMSWPDDIEALAQHGAARILVASALHDGRIAPLGR